MNRKRIFTSLILFLGTLSPQFVFAITDAEIDKKIDNILPPGYVRENGSTPLPGGNLKYDILPKLIKIFLQLAGAVSLCVFIYAGIMLIISQGNEEEMTKFKNVLIWSAVGLAFITTSYALVTGVLNVSFE